MHWWQRTNKQLDRTIRYQEIINKRKPKPSTIKLYKTIIENILMKKIALLNLNLEIHSLITKAFYKITEL